MSSSINDNKKDSGGNAKNANDLGGPVDLKSYWNNTSERKNNVLKRPNSAAMTNAKYFSEACSRYVQADTGVTRKDGHNAEKSGTSATIKTSIPLVDVQPKYKSDYRMLKDGGWKNMIHFMESHQLKIHEDEDVQLAKRILQEIREYDQEAWEEQHQSRGSASINAEGLEKQQFGRSAWK